jgi:hypothetical protein
MASSEEEQSAKRKGRRAKGEEQGAKGKGQRAKALRLALRSLLSRVYYAGDACSR